MLSIQRFNAAEHEELLLSWLYARNIESTPSYEYPEFGYVCFVDSSPTAIGFVRRVEGGYAQIDGLTTNPSQPPEARHLALDLLVSRIIDQCKDLNIKHLMAFTSDDSTLMRSKTHGFSHFDGYAVIALTIEHKG